MTTQEIQKIVGVTVDGINGPKTKAAIKAYQSANGLIPDGIVGPKTEAVMKKTSSSKVSPTNKYNLTIPSSLGSGEDSFTGIKPLPTSSVNKYNLVLPPTSTTKVNALTQGGRPVTGTVLNKPVVDSTYKSVQNSGALTPGQFSGSSPVMSSNSVQIDSPEKRVIKALQTALNIRNADKPGWVELKVDGIKGPKTIAAQTLAGSGLPFSRGPVTYISPSDTRPDYINTPEGKDSVADTSTNPSDTILSPELANSPVTQLKPEAFSTLVEQLVPGTPAYEKALEGINTAFYDIMQANMGAATAQEKQIADSDYKDLKEYIQNNLGITLSNDAIQGWDQLQTIRNQFSAQNIQGSGLQAESIDNYLKKIRQTDSNARVKSDKDTADAQETYYRTYATSEQIKALIDSDPQKAKDYGLLPSDGKTLEQRKVEMKSLYPNLTDAEISRSLSAMYDDNGYYRSNLYQKYMTGNNPLDNTGTIGDSGILDIQETTKLYRQSEIDKANIKAVEDARKREGLTPPVTGNDPNTNTQFLNQAPPPTTTEKPPVGSPIATPSNPIGQSNPTIPEVKLTPNQNLGGYKGTGQYGTFEGGTYNPPDVKNPYGSYSPIKR